MAQQEIDVGSVAGDGTGDPLREAFTKINENFTELYSGNVQVTAANIRVYSVAGRTGNVVLTVNDVAQAASKSYVNSAISANLANVTTTITNSLSANITAANAKITNHESRITTLESNAATQATAITNLNNTRATVAYVDTSIGLALSSNAILANVVAVNANVAAANAAILLRANLSGANFTGNISANTISASNFIRTNTYFVGGSEINQSLGQQWANPAALFFGDSSASPNYQKYYQINLQNLDPQGSGDIVVTADDGTDASNYIALGIGGSQYSDAAYPAGFPHDGYVTVTGGNLALQSFEYELQLFSGNLTHPQLKLTTANIIQLGPEVRIIFPDGTIQNTAFGGNANIASVNANITAANAAISSLQANASSQALDINNLNANAATQAGTLNNLLSNAASQAISINNLNANIGAYQTFANANAAGQSTAIDSINANIIAANINIASLLSNASTQSLDISNLYSNATAQQDNITALQSNAATQASQINQINANVTSANASITSLISNAAVQATQINLLNANVAAANISITTLQSNAAAQALDLNNLYANVNFYLSNVATSNANIAAANARIIVIDANLGSVSSNVTSLQSNAAAQAMQINLINANVSAANISKANLSGAIFSGNVQAEYLLANTNAKIRSTLEVGDPSSVTYANLGGVFVSNVDNYYQVVVQNTSNGPNASGDFVITADDGDDSNYYLNIGINSSNFVGTFENSGLDEFPHDGYMTVVGGNAAIRSDGNVFIAANTKVVSLLKDGNFLLFNTNLQFSDGSTLTNANIGRQPYSPNNAANYNKTITNIQDALDELAARLRALGG